MTNATSKLNPIPSIAVHDQVEPILALNAEGHIDVLLFDRAPPNMVQEFPIHFLANANLVYAFSQELQLNPGDSQSGDQKIIEHITKFISPNVVDPQVVIKELFEAWNALEAKKNQSVKKIEFTFQKYDQYPQSSYQNAAIIFKGLNDSFDTRIFKGLNNLFGLETWVFLQVNELLRSSLDKRPFLVNPFAQRDCLMDSLDQCLLADPSSTPTVLKIKGIVHREFTEKYGEWLIDVQGLIGTDIQHSKNELGFLGKVQACLTKADYKGLHSLVEEETHRQVGMFLSKRYDPELLQKSLSISTVSQVEKSLPSSKQPPNIVEVRQAIQAAIWREIKSIDKVDLEEVTLGISNLDLKDKKPRRLIEEEENPEAQTLLQRLKNNPQSFSNKELQGILRDPRRYSEAIILAVQAELPNRYAKPRTNKASSELSASSALSSSSALPASSVQPTKYRLAMSSVLEASSASSALPALSELSASSALLTSSDLPASALEDSTILLTTQSYSPLYDSRGRGSAPAPAPLEKSGETDNYDSANKQNKTNCTMS